MWIDDTRTSTDVNKFFFGGGTGGDWDKFLSSYSSVAGESGQSASVPSVERYPRCPIWAE